MAACANCGAGNPDGNRFCQNCGAALAAPAPQQPAAAAPPPPPAMAGTPPAPAYQSPYYQPQAGPPVTVSRTSPWLIIGIIGGLFVFMLVVVLVIAAIVLRPGPSPNPRPVAAQSSAPTTVPSSAPTNQPVSPTPTPSRSTGGSNIIKTSGFQVNAPGWKTLHQDSTSVTLLSPQQDGTLFIQAGQLKTRTDTNTFVADFLAGVAQKYPNATECLKPKSETHGGKDGIILGACYSYTPQTGAAFQAADVVWASVDDNNNLFLYEVFCATKDFDNVYNKEVLPVVANDSLQWA